MSKRRKFDQYKSVITKSLAQEGSEVVEENTPTIPAVSAAIEKTGGVVKARSLFLVDVDSCQPWAFADRDISEVNDDSCALLIDDIRKNGQKVPAIVRRAPDESSAEYEVISGRRRLYAASKTKDRKLLVDLRVLDDKEAAQIMVMENENREDISEIERAINMYEQLKGGVWDSIDEMRRAYSDMDNKKYSQSSFSRILKAGRISETPDVLSLFRPISTLKVRPARELVDALEKNSDLLNALPKKIIQVADLLSKGKKLQPHEIIHRLLIQELSSEEINHDGGNKIYPLPGYKKGIEVKASKTHLTFKINRKALDKLGNKAIIKELTNIL